MGSLSQGSLSFRRYYIKDEIGNPIDFLGSKSQEISSYRFRGIDQDPEKEISMGWVSIHSLLDNEFNIEDIYFKEHVIFSMRVDKRIIPTNLFKAHLERTKLNYLEKNNKTKIFKEELQMLKQKLRAELLKTFYPIPYVYDISWNMKTNIVSFYSTSKTLNEDFVELFYSTFKLRLRLFDAVSMYRGEKENKE